MENRGRSEVRGRRRGLEVGGWQAGGRRLRPAIGSGFAEHPASDRTPPFSCENRQMRSRIQTGVLPSEAAEFREELRRIFQELDQTGGDAGPTGECSPPLDVIETDTSVDIVMDLPGVNPDSVRILMRGSTVLIAGQKAPRRVRPDSSFHLVERGYGRFARAVRLTSACDGGRASAVLAHGELRISIPRIVERRGRSIRIAVSDSPTTNA